MSREPGKNQIAQPGSSFVLLLRRDNAPELNFDTDDLSSVANIDMRDYAMPFNTVLPMSEFDTMRQVLTAYDLHLGLQERDGDRGVRQVSVGDIILLTFKYPSPRWEFVLLTPQFKGRGLERFLKCIERYNTIEPGPGNIAHRFSMLRIIPQAIKHVSKQIARTRTTNK